GHNAIDVGNEVGYFVGTAGHNQCPSAVAGGVIGAEIDVDAGTDGADRAVVFNGGVDVLDLIAGLVGNMEVFGAILDPLDGTAKFLRCGGGEQVVGDVAPLRAECAADIGRDD